MRALVILVMVTVVVISGMVMANFMINRTPDMSSVASDDGTPSPFPPEQSKDEVFNLEPASGAETGNTNQQDIPKTEEPPQPADDPSLNVRPYTNFH